MFIGRTAELSALKESYQSGKNTLTILYGRTGIGKTALVKEFIKDKPCLYYNAPQAAEGEQIALFAKAVSEQLGDTAEEENVSAADTVFAFDESFAKTDGMDAPVKLVVIEEFQNIIRQSKIFMSALARLVRGEIYAQPVMVICTSSSISWVENNMVSAIGAEAYAITGFLKLKELSFADTVRMFPHYPVPDSMLVYAVTGGVPSYMAEFSDTLTIRENICRNILAAGRKLRTEGGDYIKEELRETSLYNTILHHIAMGAYKLNELHILTGFGRDKISVYLKNLIEREIVDKIFSYDTKGNEYTRKGLYRIRSGYTQFWFRYIYGHESQLELLEAESFYDRYIADTIDAFAKETFVKVGTEFIELLDSMNKLPISIDRKGRWWGKNGDIDIIACDTQKHYLIGKCSWLTDVFTFEMFEELMYNVNLAGIGKDYIYLFSKGSFDKELEMFAQENKNVNLVCLNDL